MSYEQNSRKVLENFFVLQKSSFFSRKKLFIFDVETFLPVLQRSFVYGKSLYLLNTILRIVNDESSMLNHNKQKKIKVLNLLIHLPGCDVQSEHTLNFNILTY